MLSASFEVKEFGDGGRWMCYTMHGMACVVRPTPALVAASESLPNNSDVPVVDAVVLPQKDVPPSSSVRGSDVTRNVQRGAPEVAISTALASTAFALNPTDGFMWGNV